MNRLAVVERRVHNHAEVKRLTALIERSHDIRGRLRKEKAVEIASLQILQDLALLFRDCGDLGIANALEFRLSQIRNH